MRLRMVPGLMVLAMTVSALAIPAAALQDKTSNSADPISGEWNVFFKVEDTTTPAKFNLKLDGNKVTGTVYSDHTGPGTLRDGTWADNKLSFTVDFKTHQSIAVDGTLKDGKLAGKFRTEGFESDWEATK
jgi:hypothetical protein